MPRTWNRSIEREIRDFEYRLEYETRLYEQLRRMHERGPLGTRASPARPTKLRIDPWQGKTYICALCDRDVWIPTGLNLLLADSDAVVCWICGDEHDPELTAEALAGLAVMTPLEPAYVEHWRSLLRELGALQRSIDLDEAWKQHQAQVRAVKEAGLMHRETWLGDAPAA